MSGIDQHDRPTGDAGLAHPDFLDRLGQHQRQAAGPRLGGGLSPFTGDILAKAGAFVTATTYRGAVDPNGPKWYEGWVNYADN